MSGQTRLYVELAEAEAHSLARHYEVFFEEEGHPVALFETAPDSELWAISIYFENDETSQAANAMAQIAADNGFDVEVKVEQLADINWVSQTLQELSPVIAGRFIVYGSHDADIPTPHQHAICVDAGLAFGTGHHGTTAGCLDMLDKALKAKKYYNALDIGTGSGVLAMAIAKAAHIPVLATDIDPVATQTANDNCRNNGVASEVKCLTATGFNHREIKSRAPYDLIVANILARPLEKMAAELARHSASNATIILSGLLPHQRARIISAYRQQGFVHEYTHYRNGWIAIVLKSFVAPQK